MIEEFIQRADKISRIVRPRGWGKTVNLDMLKTFLQIEIDETGKPLQKAKRKNFKLFAGGTIDLGFDKKQQLKPLKIAESKFAIEHQGKYPVVWVSFENITGTNATEILTDLKKLISDLYDRHGYLNANVPAGTENNFTVFRDQTYTNDSQVTEGLETLIKLMYAHFNQKVYVFIDDYDKPVTNALAALYDVYKTDQCTYPDWIIFAKVAKSKRFRQIRRLFKLLLSKTLEENTAVQQAVITGVYYLSFFDPVVKGLNNVTDYDLLNGTYSQYYGFSSEEVEDILDEKSTGKVRESIRLWYGYNATGNVTHNPWSIERYLSNKAKLDLYRKSDDDNDNNNSTNIADKVMLAEDTQTYLRQLIDGEAVESEIRSNLKYGTIAGDLTVLLFGGYLNPLSYDRSLNRSTLTVANEEAASIIRTRMLQSICRRLNATTEDFAYMANLLLLDNDDNSTKELVDKLQTYLARPRLRRKTVVEHYLDGICKSMIRGVVYSFSEEDYKIESFRNRDNDKRVTILVLSKRKTVPHALIDHTR